MRAKQDTFSAAVCALLGAAAMMLLAIPSAHPHHSFAVYDFATEVAFEGVVESVNFRNPHIAMTLAWEDEDGDTQIIDFVEGAPANMLVRSGFDPNWLAPGSRITAIGSPRHDNPDAFFLKSVILEDGSEHRSIGN